MFVQVDQTIKDFIKERLEGLGRDRGNLRMTLFIDGQAFQTEVRGPLIQDGLLRWDIITRGLETIEASFGPFDMARFTDLRFQKV